MSSALRVKICGLTTANDAAAAIAAGADALGLNFYPGSKRYLDHETAAWLREIPDTVRRVAVVVNPTIAEARSIAALPFIDGLQLHGAESEGFCAQLRAEGIRFGKALPVAHSGLRHDPAAFSTRTIVLDAENERGFGGTGSPFAWSLAQRLVQEQPTLRFVLAGGLSPENVAAAVALVRPFGVDATSGIESSPGRKDYARLRAFIAAARAA